MCLRVFTSRCILAMCLTLSVLASFIVDSSKTVQYNTIQYNMTNPDTLHLARVICHGPCPSPENESNPVIIRAASIDYPSLETV